jgi:UDP-N-acetylglucosamine transferase subunit ALG13
LILVTVGGQLPFDRLVGRVDAWAGVRGAPPVFAQIGQSDFVPSHMDYAKLLPVSEFERRVVECDAIVAHAGMGTILTALEHQKPLLIFPRRADQGEHRNDHQIATARYFAESGLVRAAFSEADLDRELSSIESLRPAEGISRFASDELIGRIRSFVFPGPGGPGGVQSMAMDPGETRVEQQQEVSRGREDGSRTRSVHQSPGRRCIA